MKNQEQRDDYLSLRVQNIRFSPGELPSYIPKEGALIEIRHP